MALHRKTPNPSRIGVRIEAIGRGREECGQGPSKLFRERCREAHPREVSPSHASGRLAAGSLFADLLLGNRSFGLADAVLRRARTFQRETVALAG